VETLIDLFWALLGKVRESRAQRRRARARFDEIDEQIDRRLEQAKERDDDARRGGD